MSSPMTFKRRKLNGASNVSKPFVSPLKTPRSDRAPLTSNNNAANIAYQPSVLSHTTKATPLGGGNNATPTLSRPRVTLSRSTSSRNFTPYSSKLKQPDPVEKAAQKAITALEMQIRAVRNEIDTLKQAAHLLSSTTDTDLEDLALKWKLASQAAAEEVFGTVKERVCRMGGVAAWRETEKKKYERANGLGEFAEQNAEEENDDRDCEFDSAGEELPEEEQEFRKKEKARAKKEMMESVDVEEAVGDEEEDEKAKVWQEAGQDDDAFTMDMMLRSLNIELDLIGYDKAAQRWVA